MWVRMNSFNWPLCEIQDAWRHGFFSSIQPVSFRSQISYALIKALMSWLLGICRLLIYYSNNTHPYTTRNCAAHNLRALCIRRSTVKKDTCMLWDVGDQSNLRMHPNHVAAQWYVTNATAYDSVHQPSYFQNGDNLICEWNLKWEYRHVCRLWCNASRCHVC